MEKQYSTTDLILVAALKYHKIEMVDWQKNKERFTFIFRDDNALQDVIKQFELGQLQVEPRLFWDEVRFIKGIMKRAQIRII